LNGKNGGDLECSTEKISLVWFMMFNVSIFQLFRGGQFYWWSKLEYPEKPVTCHKSLTNFIT